MLRPAALRLKSLASSLGSLSSLRDPSTSKRIYKRNGIIVDAVPDAYHSAADAQTPYAFRKALKVPNGEHGHNITKDPLYNKGSAFEHGERDRLGLRGLLPPRNLGMQVQIKRVKRALASRTTNLDKYALMRDLLDRNETLFHRMLVEYIEELAPIIYTPTVGEACTKFSSLYRRPRGMYFTMHDRGHMQPMVYNWPNDDVKVIVVTDGSRILGLGDLGANGMGIPIGKLALYCAAGGIAPQHVLPVVLDVGTNNERLLESEFYMGVQEKRLTGDEYYNVVEEFVQAIYHRWPQCVLQFEDFSTDHAKPLLDKYRNQYPCFNDDIQGTGAIVLSGLISATRLQGKRPDQLREHTILCAGAGSAGMGVLEAVRDGMVGLAGHAITIKEASDRVFVCDVKGLIAEDGCSPEEWASFTPEQQMFAAKKGSGFTRGMSLQEVAAKAKPSVLLGLSAVGGLFKEELVREVASHHERPIIFALSNPTTSSEVTAENAYRWTEGRCIFASGSPFGEVEMFGRRFTPSQCNNMFIFPGVGLGASIGGIACITDGMLQVAALQCADCLTNEERERGQVFPSVSRIRDVSAKVAAAVIQEALEEDLSTNVLPEESLDLDGFVQRRMYYPDYVPFVKTVP